MYCKYCGTYLEENAIFCGNCGKKIRPPQKQATQNQQPAKKHQSSQQFERQPEQRFNQQFERQPIGPIPVAASPVSSTGARAAGHAMRAAGEGFRTVHKTRNALITIALVVFILVTAFSLYLKYFVDGPEDTIHAFFEAYNGSDINGMIDCMDPTYQSAYGAMSDLAGSLVGDLTGFDVDFGQLADLTPYLAEAEGLLPDAQLIDVKISYSGNKLASFLAESPVNIIGIEKVLASDATATVTFTLEGQTYTENLPLASYGWGDWRIEAFSLAEQLAGSY